ncbi:hypothetical protein Dimus_005535, partial [Dionaea muscipula]
RLVLSWPLVEEVRSSPDHRQGKDGVGERWVVDNDQLGARTRLSLSDCEVAALVALW